MDAEQRGAAKSKYHDIINAMHCKIAINKEGHDRFKFKILNSFIHLNPITLLEKVFFLGLFWRSLSCLKILVLMLFS